MDSPPPPCRCGSGLAYAACCGTIHAGEPAATAAELMRSRFTAYALGLTDWVLVSWHPSTRPAALSLDDGTQWRRLQLVDTVGGEADDDTGVVEFRASYRSPDGAGVLHERSRFIRVAGRWYYVDGDQLG